jgi:hypothetical protein
MLSAIPANLLIACAKNLIINGRGRRCVRTGGLKLR